MPKTFEISHRGDSVKCHLSLGTYRDGNDAVTLMSWEPDGEYWERFATLSINTDNPVAPGEFVLNHDCNGGMMVGMLSLGLFETTGRTVDYGYVKGQPVYRITDKAREYDESDD